MSRRDAADTLARSSHLGVDECERLLVLVQDKADIARHAINLAMAYRQDHFDIARSLLRMLGLEEGC